MNRAHVFLDKIISASRTTVGMRLPPLRALAKNAGVSAASMSQALRVLVAAKKLSAFRKRGIFVGHLPMPPREGGQNGLTSALMEGDTLTTSKPGQRWEKLRATIAQDLLGGTLARSGPLPPVTEMLRRYGVSAPTLRKAFLALERDGLIKRRRREWVCAPSKAPVGQGSVLFFGVAWENGRLFYQNERFRDFLAGLETSAHEASLRVQPIGYPPRKSREKLKALVQSAFEGDPVVGAVIWSTGLPPQALQRLLQDLQSIALKRAVRTPRHKEPLRSSVGMPIAIIDEIGNLEITETLKIPWRIFRTAGLKAGLMAGNRLLALGHRRVAYLTPFGSEPWSLSRQRGLQEAFVRAGLAQGVHVLAEDLQDVFSQPLPASAGLHETLERMKAQKDELRRLADKHGVPSQMDLMGYVYWAFERHLKINAFMEPHFKALLADPTITAWVCVNDAMAMLALDFLKRHQRRIPADVSIIGFDDHEAAPDYGLTTGNFALRRLAVQSLAFILGPRQQAFAAGPVLEAELLWRDRESLGPAATR